MDRHRTREPPDDPGGAVTLVLRTLALSIAAMAAAQEAYNREWYATAFAIGVPAFVAFFCAFTDPQSLPDLFAAVASLPRSLIARLSSPFVHASPKVTNPLRVSTEKTAAIDPATGRLIANKSPSSTFDTAHSMPPSVRLSAAPTSSPFVHASPTTTSPTLRVSTESDIKKALDATFTRYEAPDEAPSEISKKKAKKHDNKYCACARYNPRTVPIVTGDPFESERMAIAKHRPVLDAIDENIKKLEWYRRRRKLEADSDSEPSEDEETLKARAERLYPHFPVEVLMAEQEHEELKAHASFWDLLYSLKATGLGPKEFLVEAAITNRYCQTCKKLPRPAPQHRDGFCACDRPVPNPRTFNDAIALAARDTRARIEGDERPAYCPLTVFRYVHLTTTHPTFCVMCKRQLMRHHRISQVSAVKDSCDTESDSSDDEDLRRDPALRAVTPKAVWPTGHVTYKMSRNAILDSYEHDDSQETESETSAQPEA